MKRRAFLAGAGLLLGPPLVASAGAAVTNARIGRLSPLSPETDVPFMNAFRQALEELGWREGHTFTLVSRFAEGRAERLPELAVALVREGVDVILTGSTPGALAAKRATTRTPIVMVTTGDPIAGRIVSSLARPGGNLTGVTALGGALTAKRLEVLKETLPGIRRIAVLVNPVSEYTPPFVAERDQVSRELRISLRTVEARTPAEISTAFDTVVRERIEALMVLTDVMFITERRIVVDAAARHRVPALHFDRQFVDVGGLMFYGASLLHLYRRAAAYVDRILKGTRPADLPIEQPTTFELALNVKTARALGLTFPPALLLRADQVVD